MALLPEAERPLSYPSQDTSLNIYNEHWENLPKNPHNLDRHATHPTRDVIRRKRRNAGE